jgi:F0F1-type ATP synthase membrane subunit c/vacuolar-type H+-ATPase subunit K
MGTALGVGIGVSLHSAGVGLGLGIVFGEVFVGVLSQSKPTQK